MNNKDDKNHKSYERRIHPRIEKSFIITFYDIDHPEIKYDITQVKNISIGGMCFISTEPFNINARIRIDMQTPYLADSLILEGKVLKAEEKIKGLIYENRIEFQKIEEPIKVILEKLVDLFQNKKKEQ